MKKLLVALCATMALAGCGQPETLAPGALNPTNTQSQAEVGFTNVRSVTGTFGSQSVLSATMDRDPASRRDFVYVEVEGMPCVLHFPQANRGGLSCDWSKWQGETFEEATQEKPIELPQFIKKDLPKFPTVLAVDDAPKQEATQYGSYMVIQAG